MKIDTVPPSTPTPRKLSESKALRNIASTALIIGWIFFTFGIFALMGIYSDSSTQGPLIGICVFVASLLSIFFGYLIWAVLNALATITEASKTYLDQKKSGSAEEDNEQTSEKIEQMDSVEVNPTTQAPPMA